MAGWDAYITNLMQSSKAIKKAAIVAAADGGIWARSEDPAFSASTDELTTFVKLFDHLEDVPAKGFDLEGVHYIVPMTDDRLIFGKKQKSGIFAMKTKMTVLIACYEGETADGQECRTAVEKMSAYLAQSGY